MISSPKKLLGKECKIRLVSGQNGYGKILDMGTIGVLVEKIEDFHYDGHCFYARSSIKDILYGKQEIFFESLKKHTPHHRYDNINKIRLENFGDFFSALKSTLILLEKNNGKNFFGKILNIHTTYLTVQTFDPYGKWDKKESKIWYKDIFSVAYNNEYLTRFKEYMEIS